MDIQVELDDITVTASNLHPIEHEAARSLVIDIALDLHRALAAADAE